MAGESRAVPNVAVTVVTEEKSTTSDPLAHAKIVQGSVVASTPSTPASRWKWTKKKREALKLVMQGTAVSEVASKVKAHRNTVTLWMKAPEWLTEAQRYVSESQVSTKLRRLKTTSIIADQLAGKSIQALTEDDPNLGRTGLMLREHLNYVKAERDLFGEGEGQVGPGGPGTTLNIHLGAPGQPAPVDDGRQAIAFLAFKDYLSKYDPELAVMARTPQEATALIAEKVLQESGLLDTVREEDREAMRQESADADAQKRKR